MTNHNKLPECCDSLSPTSPGSVSEATRVSDSFCTAMIKLSPWGGQFVSELGPQRQFLETTPALVEYSVPGWIHPRPCSPEAKQTAVLASDGFFHNNIRKLAVDQSGSTVSLSQNNNL
ncbi:hypothetical protein PBY51_015618 [Eleginops maclovinus]|nr:hypothetical protein PBY51_015618 [Eleginops maclovinus]